MAHVSRKALFETLPGLDSDFHVVDARKPMKVATTQADVRGAVPLDPHNCLFARACRRRHKEAVFFRTVAYVKDGPKTVRKFCVPTAGQVQILALDASGVAMAGCSIVLRPPTGRQRVGGCVGNLSHGRRGRRASAKVMRQRAAAMARLAKYRRSLATEAA